MCVTRSDGQLLPCDRGQQRRSQPLGSSLPGGAERSFHLSGLLWRQSNRVDQRHTFCRKAGPPHFGFWSSFHFCLRKYLTELSIIVYKSLVSIFGTQPCQQSARTSLERLAHQRHPAVTGAGRERLAMKCQEQQGAFALVQSRSLSIQRQESTL